MKNISHLPVVNMLLPGSHSGGGLLDRHAALIHANMGFVGSPESIYYAV